MSAKPITRRRFLSVCAMAGAFAAAPWAHAAAALPLHRWNGILLGAEVSLTMAHPDEREAQRIFRLCTTEIKRLENIFTLFDNRSELCRLNRDGAFHGPSAELVDILLLARKFHGLTEGAFDVTVQPLWSLYSLQKVPAEREIEAARKLTGMDGVAIENGAVRFRKKGMAVTLNGIAQGYITDRITGLLRAEGLTNVLAELGEKRAIGGHPGGRPWRIGIGSGRDFVETAELRDNALATSAASGMMFDETAKTHHIFNPLTGRNPHFYRSLSVLAETAAMADALSTGFTVLGPARIDRLAKQIKGLQKIYKN